ncbi:MAG: FtsX-like permease family protein [Gemmatimonadales bacterium]|nr:FtsX-like permease family protein [Gemmatimonadales bacterium]
MRTSFVAAGLVLAAALASGPRAAAQVAPAAVPPPIEVAVERRLARALGLAVGDTLRVRPSPAHPGRLARVAAIHEPRTDPAVVMRRDLRLRLHLPDLAELLGAPDRVDRFGIGLGAGVPPADGARAIDRAAFGFRAFPSDEIARESSATFKVVSRFHRAIAVISVVASAIFLLCVMLLKVEERRLDAAVMRFVGVRRRTVFGALLLEAAAIAAVGAVVGTGLAVAAAWAVNAYYQRFFETQLLFALVTPGVVGFSVALSLALGLAAGAIAAWRLASTPPLVLWRRG